MAPGKPARYDTEYERCGGRVFRITPPISLPRRDEVAESHAVVV